MEGVDPNGPQAATTPPNRQPKPTLDTEHVEAAGSLERTWSLEAGNPQIISFGLLEAPCTPTFSGLTARTGLECPLVHADSLPLPLPVLAKPSSAMSMTSTKSQVPWIKKLLAFTGPGWLMSIAYVDPGNLEADLQCGAQFGYTLLWVLFWATLMGLSMQLVAALLGCVTRQHLAEHCRNHYSFGTRIFLWLLTELAIIGSDIQEVIGGAIGIQLLFGLPLPMGVFLTAFAAFGFLFLERFGTRPLELFFGVLIIILAGSMGGIFAVISPDPNDVLDGLLLPRLPSTAIAQAVGMVGCIIMPHNLFLHSALVQSRVIEPGEEREAIGLYAVESTAAIGTSVLINTAVIAIFAKGFYGSPEASTIGLKNAGTFLGDRYGGALRIIWGFGLCAAGQSSTMTGAYAGQWVMQGFLQLQVKPWKRAIITRSMALVPTLFVAFYFGGQRSGLDDLNSSLNVLQSLVLPFAVVPLLSFAGSSKIMGELSLSPSKKCFGWISLGLIMLANTYLFVEQLNGEMSMRLIGSVTVYVIAVLYVAMSINI